MTVGEVVELRPDLFLIIVAPRPIPAAVPRRKKA